MGKRGARCLPPTVACRRQTARAHRAHSTGTQACAARAPRAMARTARTAWARTGYAGDAGTHLVHVCHVVFRLCTRQRAAAMPPLTGVAQRCAGRRMRPTSTPHCATQAPAADSPRRGDMTPQAFCTVCGREPLPSDLHPLSVAGAGSRPRAVSTEKRRRAERAQCAQS